MERAKPKPPKVTKVKPAAGPLAGGTKVRIRGTNLLGAKKVRFGKRTAAIVKVASKSKVIVIAPAGKQAGPVPVRVITKNRKSAKTARASYTYRGTTGGSGSTFAPTLTSIDPATGPVEGGTPVTLTGTHLDGATAVSFGGTPATAVSVTSATEVQATSPAHAAGAVPVTITTAGGTSAPVTYTYTEPAADPPSVVAVVPPLGAAAGGDAVTIVGSGFTGATSVTFDGTPATDLVVGSDNDVSVTTPAHAAGPVDVVVTTPAGEGTGTAAFTYVGPPSVVAVMPLTGSTDGGTQVTITGTGFTGATQVFFGDVAATSVVVASDTSITALTPPHAAGPVDVTVVNAAGSGVGTGLFLYAGGGGGGGGTPALPPVVVAVAPPIGAPAGGTQVTISGTGFTGATSVTFGGVPATTVLVASDTSITALTPAHAIGPVDVAVTTPAGAGLGPGLFVYLGLGLPRLSS